MLKGKDAKDVFYFDPTMCTVLSSLTYWDIQDGQFKKKKKNEVHPYCNNELSTAQKGVSPTALIIIAAFELQL